MVSRSVVLTAALTLFVAACGGAAPSAGGGSPAGSAPAAAVSSGAGSTTAAANASGQAAGSGSAAASEPAPEKAKVTIALPSDTGGTMPTRVAQDGGYFAKHGLTVDVNIVSAATAAQALTSGSVDLYQGGTTPIAADLGGADLIYIASPVDRSNLMLIGQKGITSFEQLKGKAIATTTPGAFGEVATKLTAKKYNMQVGRDVKLLYHPSSSASLTTFVSGQADAIIAPPPFSTKAVSQGYPVIVDYYKQGLKIVGPALSSQRKWYQANPNTVRAFLMGYLDGLKRAFDDPAFFKATESKYAKITDQALLDSDYQNGQRVWNRDIRVDPSSIQVVLDSIQTPQAKSADVKHFFDNTIAGQVVRDYAAKLFPNDVKVS